MSFREVVHDTTTELPATRSNTTVLNKTHFNVTLAQPALINLSATQYQGAAIFPPKINDDCLPWLLYKSFFYAFNRFFIRI